MNEIQKKKWEAQREQGMFRFVLFNGVLFWGVCTAVLFSFLMPLMGEGRSFMDVFPTAIIAFPVAGIFWGGFMWRNAERQYAKAGN